MTEKSRNRIRRARLDFEAALNDVSLEERVHFCLSLDYDGVITAHDGQPRRIHKVRISTIPEAPREIERGFFAEIRSV